MIAGERGTADRGDHLQLVWSRLYACGIVPVSAIGPAEGEWMLTRVVAMHRRADLDAEAFRRHWLTVHGPLMAQVPNVHYVQNHVIYQERGAKRADPPNDIDGFAQVSFPTEDAMREAAKHPASADAGRDLPNFVGRQTRMICEVDAALPPPQPGSASKRISLLQVKPDIPAAEFRRFCSRELATMVRALPGVVACRQSFVVGMLPLNDPRIVASGMDAAAMIETWHASGTPVDADFAARQLQRGAAFLSAVSDYLVEEIQIAP